jgi:hypothetical protein
MLSVYPENQFALRAMRGGAHAYLNKGCSPDILFAAIAKVASGGLYITPVLPSCWRKTSAAAPTTKSRRTKPSPTANSRSCNCSPRAAAWPDRPATDALGQHHLDLPGAHLRKAEPAQPGRPVQLRRPASADDLAGQDFNFGRFFGPTVALEALTKCSEAALARRADEDSTSSTARRPNDARGFLSAPLSPSAGAAADKPRRRQSSRPAPNR